MRRSPAVVDRRSIAQSVGRTTRTPWASTRSTCTWRGCGPSSQAARCASSRCAPSDTGYWAGELAPAPPARGTAPSGGARARVALAATLLVGVVYAGCVTILDRAVSARLVASVDTRLRQRMDGAADSQRGDGSSQPGTGEAGTGQAGTGRQARARRPAAGSWRRAAGRIPTTPVRAPEVVETIPNIDHRFGDGRAEVIGIAVLDLAGQPVTILEPSSDIVDPISVRAHEDITLPIVGFMMRNHMDSTSRAPTPPGKPSIFLLWPRVMFTPSISIFNFLSSTLRLFLSRPRLPTARSMLTTTCDWVDNAIVLQMGPAEGEIIHRHVHLPCRVELNRCLVNAAPVLTHAEPSVPEP